MSHFTPKELYDFFCHNVEYGSEHIEAAKALKEAGFFTNKFSGMIERLQYDEEFRREVLSLSQLNSMLETAKAYGIPLYEVFFLPAVASIIKQDKEIIMERITFISSKSTDELQAAFKGELIDLSLGNVDQSKVMPILQYLKEDDFAVKVQRDPAYWLGSKNLNKTEFFFVYICAVMACMKIKGDSTFTVAPEFYKIMEMPKEELNYMIRRFMKLA